MLCHFANKRILPLYFSLYFASSLFHSFSFTFIFLSFNFSLSLLPFSLFKISFFWFLIFFLLFWYFSFVDFFSLFLFIFFSLFALCFLLLLLIAYYQMIMLMTVITRNTQMCIIRFTPPPFLTYFHPLLPHTNAHAHAHLNMFVPCRLRKILLVSRFIEH